MLHLPLTPDEVIRYGATSGAFSQGAHMWNRIARGLVVALAGFLALSACSVGSRASAQTAQDRCVAYVEKAMGAVGSGVSYAEAKEQIAKDKGRFSLEYKAFLAWTRYPASVMPPPGRSYPPSPPFDLQGACSE